MSEQKDDHPVADDAVVDGAVVDGAVVDGAVVDGALADDAVADDAVSGKAMVGEAAVPGESVAAVRPSLDPAVGQEASTHLRLRRAPRYGPFGLTGVFIGVVIGIVLALSHPAASNYSTQTIAGYFAAIFGLFGAVLGLGVAVLIERRRS